MNGRRAPRLAHRLAWGIALAQMLAIIGWTLIWMLFSPYVSYDELAAATAGRHVAASVAAGTNGARIVASPPLLDYASRRPGFAYGALYQGRLLPGSSPEMSSLLAGISVPGEGEFRTIDGREAHAEALTGAGLPITVVTIGNRIGLDDASTFFGILFPQLVAMFAPALLAAVVVTPLVMTRAMRPLRRAAAASAAIDVATLDKRLSTEGIPAEAMPLANAINLLLARLHEGIANQRLLTANAAHELRTPVAVIAARVGSMDDAPEVRALRRDVQRLTLLVDQLLAAARLQDALVIARTRLDLSALVADATADLAPLAMLSGRDVEVLMPHHAIHVVGEADSLRSAIANLLDNALRAEPAGGQVSVRVVLDGNAVLIEISDHGTGVAPQDRERVFQPFWRGNSSWQGTGLGLAITRQIVDAHGGQVACHAAADGGALFRVRLPLATDAQKPD